MSRCVIVGGAPIGNYSFIRSLLREDDFFIFCDRGLVHRNPLRAQPHLIVGDFDSHPRPDLAAETIVLPREKDDTDTVYAAKEALRRGFDRFLLVGAAGGRMDHTLCNLSILLMLHTKGKPALLADDYSLMRVVGSDPVAVDPGCAYFSLLSISGPAGGIDVKNAKYPLRDAVIDPTYQYGVSNQVLPGGEALVSVARGCLLLIEVYRDA